MKAMIFAAGLGTRLKPLTETRPKALIEVGGKTLLERSISYLKHYGVTDITVNVHHFAGQIIDFLKQHDHFGVSIHLSDETGQLLDTGGGVLKARPWLEGNEAILLMNTDILTNLDLKRFSRVHRESKALASLVVRQRETSRYLLFDAEGCLSGWKNVKTGELRIARPENIGEAIPMAFSGIHLIEPELFSLITESSKFSIIDLYLRLAATGKIMAYRDTDSVWMDLGKFEEMEEAERLVRLLDAGEI
ncbi:MAG: nucleotidyltransferase family protein [Prolixibacteraceae bacterium]